jgi:hypothetical protein
MEKLGMAGSGRRDVVQDSSIKIVSFPFQRDFEEDDTNLNDEFQGVV